MKTNSYSSQSPVAAVPGTIFFFPDGGSEFFPHEHAGLSFPEEGCTLDHDPEGREVCIGAARTVTRRSGYLRTEPLAEGAAVAAPGLMPRSGAAVRQLVTETAHGRIREGVDDYTLNVRVTKSELARLVMSMESFFETETMKLLIQRGQPTTVGSRAALRHRSSLHLRRHEVKS